jgi:hypothetical protein
MIEVLANVPQGFVADLVELAEEAQDLDRLGLCARRHPRSAPACTGCAGVTDGRSRRRCAIEGPFSGWLVPVRIERTQGVIKAAQV